VKRAFFGLASLLFLFASYGLAPAADRRLPAFELKLLDGSTLRSKDLAGRVTVIDFWATWCQPCLAEIEEYNRFYRAYGSKVRFVALAAESGTEKEVKLAVKELKIEYPVAAPTAQELDVFGDIAVLPTTWIVDPEGRIAREFLGVPPGKHAVLRELVEKLLKKDANPQIPNR
jgi:thiol-disulfide isomerase/thioredoxin